MATIHQFAESLSSAIDAKDAYTEKHSMEVAEISRILAHTLGLGEELEAIIHIVPTMNVMTVADIPTPLMGMRFPLGQG